MAEGRDKLVKYLNEALAQELALITTLQTHISMTEKGSYRGLLQKHLRETQVHAQQVERRLGELGFTRSPLESGMGLVQTVVGQALVLVKAPMDLLRGRSVEEKMLKNARDEAMTEIGEIATYEAIEHLAVSVGDLETAQLVAAIRKDEEAMLEGLRREIPGLTGAVVESEIPAGERSVVTLDEPWEGYDEATVAEIQERLAGAPETVRARVREYERKHKVRKTVIQATNKESSRV